MLEFEYFAVLVVDMLIGKQGQFISYGDLDTTFMMHLEGANLPQNVVDDAMELWIKWVTNPGEDLGKLTYAERKRMLRVLRLLLIKHYGTVEFERLLKKPVSI